MTKLSPESLSVLVGEIYDCCLNPAGWVAALTQITIAFDAAYTAISLGDPHSLVGGGNMAATSPWDVMRLRELNEVYGVEGVPGLREVALGGIDEPRSTLSQMSELEFHQSEFYQHWVKPQGLREACVTKFAHTEDRIGIMAQITANNRDIITQSDRDFIALISPHVRRAALIGDLLNHQRIVVESYQAALQSLITPIILTDANQKINFANCSAETLLSDGSIIASQSGRLMVRSSVAERALIDAIARTANTGQELGRRGIGIPLSTHLTAPDSVPSIAYVMPLAGNAERSVFGQSTAAVFISMTTSANPPPEAALVALFDLTPTEAKVMCRLGTSQDLPLIAREMDVSINTLKTHVARVYQKTNTRKQADIVRLVNELGLS
jgi:DNA-binding CsgD family transcriptional regulator